MYTVIMLVTCLCLDKQWWNTVALRHEMEALLFDTIEAWTKLLKVCRWQFQTHFSWMKIFESWLRSTEMSLIWCLLLLISMLWHRQAIFKSKGDKLSSSAECRIRTQRVSGTESPADWMPADKPTELLRIKLKNFNSTARPYDQRAFSPLDPTAIWHSHLALAIYMLVVVNFDALAQASDFRIERRQVVFLCWMQDSNPEGLWNRIFSRLNACRWQFQAHFSLMKIFESRLRFHWDVSQLVIGNEGVWW